MNGNALRPSITGIILAGGQSRRMGGGDKGLLPFGGRPLLAHVIARLAPQVRGVAINANGDPDRFAAFGLPVVGDPPEWMHCGPLAGILAGLRYAAAYRSDAEAIATVPSDTPFLAADLVARLAEASRRAHIAIARSEGRIHPVIGLFPLGCADDLDRFLGEGSSRRVDAWLARHDVRFVDFIGSVGHGPSPFLNINTPEDLDAASAFLDRAGSLRLPS